MKLLKLTCTMDAKNRVLYVKADRILYVMDTSSPDYRGKSTICLDMKNQDAKSIYDVLETPDEIIELMRRLEVVEATAGKD